ncbi:uncharacterized protein BYT42DRAFT_550431 [Radiomyces spectabilis]|uniref:uncharacterized protein n=1 Tax=Radiomyces spectabilis TaxID=64574 RepID=UPI00221FE32D|nr:uncharacterized protein BYT42DRAFT_550431 [Radiomyces spectabilis]KAI8364166.1 hypothetical protein BYT42DRAFT_550431 [Radiomyces spectabilis]
MVESPESQASTPTQNPATPLAPTEQPLPSTMLQFEHHEALPSFMTAMVTQMNQVLHRLDEYDQLKAENHQLNQSLAAAEARIAQLEAQFETQYADSTPIGAMASKPPYNRHFPSQGHMGFSH